jgi:hypothetical protein
MLHTNEIQHLSSNGNIFFCIALLRLTRVQTGRVLGEYAEAPLVDEELGHSNW